MRKATFGSGCFWCSQEIFSSLKGVESVVAGYSGGHVENPSYEEVCSGETGHAEVVQVVFSQDIISYIDLLDVFFRTHNPTMLNRQGNDIGTQYRSVVFYHDEKQKKAILNKIKQLNGEGIWDKPVITEVAPAGEFYLAEEYHQFYFSKNPDQPYCKFVVLPKVAGFMKNFKDYCSES